MYGQLGLYITGDPKQFFNSHKNAFSGGVQHNDKWIQLKQKIVVINRHGQVSLLISKRFIRLDLDNIKCNYSICTSSLGVNFSFELGL